MLPPAQSPVIKHPSRIISGGVFRDRKGNGVQDEGEDGLGGLEVEIATSVTGERVRFVTTLNGIYSAVVAGGNNLQVVRVIVPNGLFPTWSSEQTITSGENVVVNFGLQGMSPWTIILLVISLILLGAMVVTALDRRPLAYAALAKELEVIARRRIEEVDR